MTIPIKFRRPAFTVIELLVVISILSTISVLVVMNLSQARLQARNSTRKSSASVLAGAVKTMYATDGTLFITYKGLPCAITGQSSATPSIHGSGSGAGCTGASGLAYGLMDVASSPLTPGIKVSTSGSNGHDPHDYAVQSITSALIGKYLSSDEHDPLTGANNDPSQRHPALLRCCVSGSQNVGQNGNSFAVWVQLESVGGTVTLNTTDQNNTDHACGGSAAKPDAYPGYLMDYGNNDTAPTYDYAVAGGVIPKTVQAGLPPSTCPVG
jgi:prepilin-type N-terminal cleavage/methylation domain-containing protein